MFILRISLLSCLLYFCYSWIYQFFLIMNYHHEPNISQDSCCSEVESEDDSIHPFEISVSEQDMRDIHLRLNISRGFTPALEGTQHDYGLNEKVLKTILEHLRNYNFTERQHFLNAYPQFITRINGMNIHFIHISPRNSDNVPVLPLLLLHGWPSSVREFYEAIPVLLAGQDGHFSIELVIPSLTGFGYSDGPTKLGCHSPHVGNLMRLLMERLGHRRFYVHGSDWGAVVATGMTTMFPESVIGLHSNFCFSLRYITLLKTVLGSLYPSMVVDEEYVSKMYPLITGILRFYISESAYMHMFGTKPDTIGHGLDNSLEGLISFLFEKFSIGKNKLNLHVPSAGVTDIEVMKLLDIILFYYWFPKKATTSARFYSENLGIEGLLNGLHNSPISDSVPCGCAYFEDDFIYQPQSFLKDKFTNLVHYSTYKSVGHFAAIEATNLLADDILSFINKV
ncbi:unnamed protein product, partial [Phaedon cochleariae]